MQKNFALKEVFPMSTSSKTRFTSFAALGLPAAMARYYDTYPNWPPGLYPFAMAALFFGVAALTLLTL